VQHELASKTTLGVKHRKLGVDVILGQHVRARVGFHLGDGCGQRVGLRAGGAKLVADELANSSP
jgi:hypothetical protein